MKKKSLILLSILFSLFIFEKTFSKAFYIGQIIRGEIEINKSFKINLPPGEWEVIRKSADTSYGLNQRIVGIVRVENNQWFEAIEIYEGLLGGIYQAAINEAITEFSHRDDRRRPCIRLHACRLAPPEGRRAVQPEGLLEGPRSRRPVAYYHQARSIREGRAAVARVQLQATRRSYAGKADTGLGVGDVGLVDCGRLYGHQA